MSAVHSPILGNQRLIGVAISLLYFVYFFNCLNVCLHLTVCAAANIHFNIVLSFPFLLLTSYLPSSFAFDFIFVFYSVTAIVGNIFLLVCCLRFVSAFQKLLFHMWKCVYECLLIFIYLAYISLCMYICKYE